MSFVITPPRVSIPSDNGVTSRSSTSFTSPPRTPPWIAAPKATTSSGLTPLWGSFPNTCFTTSCTAGIRVVPPTRMTSSISAALSFASRSAFRQGSFVRSTRSAVICSKSARVRLTTRCFGPDWSAVRNGRLISAFSVLESSILAFSAASFRR